MTILSDIIQPYGSIATRLRYIADQIDNGSLIPMYHTHKVEPDTNIDKQMNLVFELQAHIVPQITKEILHADITP